jgi:hypothetical protein
VADPFAPPAEPTRRRGAPADTTASAPAYRSEPAHPGMFWVVAAVGVGLICLGTLVSFFTYMGDLDGEDVAPALFGVFGTIALAVGLALAAVLQRGLSTGIRVALLLGAGYFAVSGNGFGLFAALASNPFF